MKKFLILPFLLFSFFSFVIISCQNSENFPNDSSFLGYTDSLYIMPDKFNDQFDIVAVTKSKYFLAIKKDSVFGFLCVFDSVYHTKNALVAYTDSVGNVQRIIYQDLVFDIFYHKIDNKLDILLSDANGNVSFIQNVEGGTNTSHTRSAVWSPTSIIANIALGIKGIAEGTSSFNKGLSGSLAVAGIINTITNGNVITTIGINAATLFLPGAGWVEAVFATLDITNALIENHQRNIVKKYIGEAEVLTGVAVQTDEQKVTLSCSINDISAVKNNCNIGILIAKDHLYDIVDKRHCIERKYAKISESKNNVFSFSFNIKDHAKYNYRAFIEPFDLSGYLETEIGYYYFDYSKYGKIKQFQISNPDIQILDAKQISAVSNNNHNYTFYISVSTSCNCMFKDWGIALFRNLHSPEIVQLQTIGKSNVMGTKTFCFKIEENDIFMNTTSKPFTPLAEYYVTPYIVIENSIIYDKNNKYVVQIFFDEQIKPTSGEAIDLGLSVKWAAWNIGASSIGESGGLYGWGDPTGTNTKKTEWIGSGIKYPKDWDGYGGNDAPRNIAGTNLDLATQKWGNKWRMPSIKEWQELYINCSCSEISYKGIRGMLCIARNGNSIFLPYNGMRSGTEKREKEQGYYWTSELNDSIARNQMIYMPGLAVYSNVNAHSAASWCDRSYGYSIRAVCQ